MIVYMLYMASPVLLYIGFELLTKTSVNNNDRARKVYLACFFLIMTLMVGLRNPHNGSGDTMFYYTFWERISKVPYKKLFNFTDSVDMEIGYQLTAWALSKVFRGGQWCLFLSGMFFAASVCIFVKRNCKNVVLALTVFNCLGLFNFMVQGQRQAIAMCICLFALEQCKKDKTIMFLLLIVFAMLFHSSAVVFAIVYILNKLKLNLKSYCIVGVSAAAAMALLPRLFAMVNFFINDSYEIGQGAESGGVVAVLIYIAILVFGMIFKDTEDRHYPLYIYMAIVGVMAMVLRNYASSIVERISSYFAFAQMVVISNSVRAMKNPGYEVLVNSAVALLCIFVALHKASYSELIPYLFFWQ